MLSDTTIRRAKAADKPYKLTDGRGLHLEVRPSGGKYWRYRYRIDGKENLYALGEYCEAPKPEAPEEAKLRRDGGRFTLAEARLERARCRDLVKQGIHPAQHRNLDLENRQQQNANTFKVIAAEWLEQRAKAKRWDVKTKEQRVWVLDTYINPHIGDQPVRRVTPAQCLAVMKKTEEQAPYFAVMTRQIMSATFNHAMATMRADVDPVAPIKDAITAPPPKHKKPLNAAGIPPFFQKLEAFQGTQSRNAIKLLWWTLARTVEVLKAQWSEFDLDAGLWRIPGERMKRRTMTDHFIPLPKQAIELLRTLRSASDVQDYVFTHRSKAKQPPSRQILYVAFMYMGYGPDKFTPHGIRTTGSTMLNEMGYNGDWIERQLAHNDRNETRASYNGAKYLDQRRQMMQEWADYLDGLCAGKNVVPLKARAA